MLLPERKGLVHRHHGRVEIVGLDQALGPQHESVELDFRGELEPARGRGGEEKQKDPRARRSKLPERPPPLRPAHPMRHR